MHERYSTIAEHYDLPTRFYQYLGKNLSYSCNLWDNATNNDEASEAKWKLYADLLELKPEHKVLEIGSGWGGNAHYFKKNYGVDIEVINSSEEQNKRTRELGIKATTGSWETFTGQYDRIVTDGCLVHQKDLQFEFFKKIKELLKPNGRALIKEMHVRDFNFLKPSVCHLLNTTFGLTGQYRTLEMDIMDLEYLGFKVTHTEMDIMNYDKTIDEWQKLMRKDATEMKKINEERYWLDLATWHLFRTIFRSGTFGMDILVCE